MDLFVQAPWCCGGGGDLGHFSFLSLCEVAVQDQERRGLPRAAGGPQGTRGPPPLAVSRLGLDGVGGPACLPGVTALASAGAGPPGLKRPQ